jgi:hypothetical protein
VFIVDRGYLAGRCLRLSMTRMADILAKEHGEIWIFGSLDRNGLVVAIRA